MAYPSPSSINAGEGLVGFFKYANYVSGSWLSNMILIAVYVIFLMAYYRTKDDFLGGMGLSGFATFVIALLFFIGEVITGTTLMIAFAVMLVGVVIVIVDDQR